MLGFVINAAIAAASAAAGKAKQSDDNAQPTATEADENSGSMWPLYVLMAIEAALFAAPVAAMMWMAYKLLPIVLR
jgi:hypothetical protein